LEFGIFNLEFKLNSVPTTRHIKQHNWEGLRGQIEHIIRDKNLQPTDLRPLGIHEDWQSIEENIYSSFCRLDHAAGRPVWLWEHFKQDDFSIRVTHPYLLLDKLVDEHESVWFFINDYRGKFWFYEGHVKAIIQVIAEVCGLDEVYLVFKKYQWLICINHHDYLIATGQTMPDKLRHLQAVMQGIVQL
jgi:hypothetical protein